jgi:hypothetical protein
MTNMQTATVDAASVRAESLARRLEEGVDALAAFAATLTDAQWRTAIPKDGRPVGVVVHHVASVFPIEIELAQMLAKSQPITGVTWDGIHEMNANHAREHAGVTKQAALDLLRENGAKAAAAIRAFTDADLAGAATVSLYSGAPLTCQFMLEDHAVRHSYHHFGKIRGALQA